MTNGKKLTYCSLMIALALALSYMERFIPLQLLIPLPGVKIGLSNIVTLVALYLFSARCTYGIVIVRCILGAVFGGGITGLLFSLTGGLFALTVMAAARHFPLLSVYGVSILGAAAHGAGQILAAMLLMKSVYIGAYLPWLLLTGIATGFLTGTAGAGIIPVLLKAVNGNRAPMQHTGG